MLHIYQHNLTEALLDQLSAIIGTIPDGFSALDCESILVQNPDMAQWLKIELAQRHGIAANIEFPMPSSFVWKMFNALYPELPEQSPFSKENMTWHLMTLLPDLMNHKEFAWVERYLGDVTADKQQQEQRALKSYRLCAAIADIFDQYLIYRPQWMANWEQDEVGGEVTPQQAWQPILWQRLNSSISGSSGARVQWHRGELLTQTIDSFNAANLDNSVLQCLPKRLFIFGISSLPEQSLALFNALANHIEVHWFQINPCQEFWLDIIDGKSLAKLAAKPNYQRLADLADDRYFLVGNPLLASLGTLGREHLSLMLEQLQGDWHEAYRPYPTTGALGLLQNEVLNLSIRGQFEALSATQLTSNIDKISLNDNDCSNVLFHSCYSPMREIEVLKDQLLFLFERDPSLTPNDVMVMVPDVSEYAPYIHATFSGITDDYRLFYSINDLSAQQESPLADCLLNLFDLPQSRWYANELMSILEVPAVMRKFAIDEHELDIINRWIDDVGIRWGINAAHRRELGFISFEENSWLFGAQRLLLGYAMHPAQGCFDGLMPYSQMEGAQTEALGKLLMFVDCLLDYRTQLAGDYQAGQWLTLVNQMMNDFFEGEASEVVWLQQPSQCLEGLKQYIDQSGYQQTIHRTIIKDYLQQSLQAQSSNSRFKAGAINFCTLMPMRSIPFKVIALLGMNENAFPRQNHPVNFDLMANQRVRGDRSRRLDDRYLFLEALLSTRQHLHLSWVGQDIRDDSHKPPSILISEVRDYIAEAWIHSDSKATDEPAQVAQELLSKMTHQHPLQAYQAINFSKQSAQQSFASLWSQALALSQDPAFKPPRSYATHNPQLSRLEAEHQELSLTQLERFMVNPCRVFMQRTLEVYFDEIELDTLQHEPFVIDTLQQWQLSDKALTMRLANAQQNQFDAHYQGTGKLPFGEASTQTLAKAWDEGESIVTHFSEYLQEDKQSDVLRLSFDEPKLMLTAELPKSKRHLRCQLKAGSIKDKDIVRAYLRHLSSCASGADYHYLLLDKKNACVFKAIPNAQAHSILAQLISLYQQGLQQPLPLLVDAGISVAIAKVDEKTQINALETLNELWQQNKFSHRPVDEYLTRCFKNAEEAYPAFIKLTEQILVPLVEHAYMVPPKGQTKTAKIVVTHKKALDYVEGLLCND
ncbi:exodeoxyribonuclease V subunit gamma [Paraferrimonas haliotis]|uniref:exodeoxyribonuclease V subunit gamma n=1 Tax=Paraferrimonas haliotis TaxID=2013866 RepID=UPI000BA92445|nr:exodeoxyribonuclease V subunit gamma [Paraferrimonas haliotis]